MFCLMTAFLQTSVYMIMAQKNFVKRVVEQNQERHLIHVLNKADLMEFHHSFLERQFTDFNDFYTLSDQELVDFVIIFLHLHLFLLIFAI